MLCALAKRCAESLASGREWDVLIVTQPAVCLSCTDDMHGTPEIAVHWQMDPLAHRPDNWQVYPGDAEPHQQENLTADRASTPSQGSVITHLSNPQARLGARPGRHSHTFNSSLDAAQNEATPRAPERRQCTEHRNRTRCQANATLQLQYNSQQASLAQNRHGD